MAADAPWNLSTLLLDAHLDAGNGARTAIRYQGRSTTYSELAGLVARTGNALHELGVDREQRVAMLIADRPEFIATFLGAVRIGAVAVPLNTLLRPAEAIELIQHCGATALVAEASILDGLRPLLPSAERLRVVVAVGGAAPDALSFDALCAAARAELAPADTVRDDMCFWQYSSGTTGRPKAVMHRQYDYTVNTEAYGRAVIGMTADDRSFSLAKLFFSYGLGNSMAFPLRYGASTILHPDRPEPRAVLDLIRTERPTLFYAVPTAYAQILALAEREPDLADLSSIRHCVSAGEALPAALFERWKARFGVEILDGIGTTEILHIFLSNPPGRARPGSSGLAVPGYEARIVDEEGLPVPQGEIGSLRVKGDSTMAYYWNQHEKTKATLFGEWIQTGDKYYQDKDGYFWYCGRSDDMLKVGGIWVSPVEVEATLIKHPAVLEAAVVGKEDTDRLVKPKAFVVLKEPWKASDELADELKGFVKDKIAPYKYPRWIEFVGELPKTATGKIQRFKLR